MTEKKNHYDVKELEIAQIKADTYAKLIREGFPVRIALKISGMFEDLTTEECIALVEEMCKKCAPIKRCEPKQFCSCNRQCCSGCFRRYPYKVTTTGMYPYYWGNASPSVTSTTTYTSNDFIYE